MSGMTVVCVSKLSKAGKGGRLPDFNILGRHKDRGDRAERVVTNITRDNVAGFLLRTPCHVLFRISLTVGGLVSKAFTAAAILQLQEQGRLSGSRYPVGTPEVN
jgi:hypothetical protein